MTRDAPAVYAVLATLFLILAIASLLVGAMLLGLVIAGQEEWRAFIFFAGFFAILFSLVGAFFAAIDARKGPHG